eukprot:14077066-Ditylum_brightwellii.AAC.1
MFAINDPAEGVDGKKGKKLSNTPKRVLQGREIAYLDIRWRFQKNGENGQKIKFAKNINNKQICPVLAAARIHYRSQRLKLKKASTIAAYKSEKGAVILMTDKNNESVLQSLARKLYDITNAKESRRFKSHSICIGVAVALHTGGKNGGTNKSD